MPSVCLPTVHAWTSLNLSRSGGRGVPRTLYRGAMAGTLYSGDLPVNRMTYTYDWKHFLPGTSLASGNDGLNVTVLDVSWHLWDRVLKSMLQLGLVYPIGFNQNHQRQRVSHSNSPTSKQNISLIWFIRSLLPVFYSSRTKESKEPDDSGMLKGSLISPLEVGLCVTFRITKLLAVRVSFSYFELENWPNSTN